jgi:pimeloyl-ACP methyl ester carboxylesterase
VGQSWINRAKSIAGPTFIMQYGNVAFCFDIDSIYDNVIDEVTNLFKNDKNFVIVAHSFGTLLALKVGKSLELLGKTGKLVFVDGAPKLAMTLKSFLPKPLTNDALETYVLSITCPLISGNDSGETLKEILAEKGTWSQKVNKFAEIGTAKKIYSYEFYVLFLNGVFNRLRAMISIDVNNFPVLDSSSGILLRPTEHTVKSINEDYGEVPALALERNSRVSCTLRKKK